MDSLLFQHCNCLDELHNQTTSEWSQDLSDLLYTKIEHLERHTRYHQLFE